jgi:hypothetical protein
VYTVGFQNYGTHDIATLWICDELGDVVLAKSLGISNKNSNASAITSLNQTIYIIGKQNNGSVDVATLWVYKRLSDSISSKPLENDQNDSTTSSIVAYNQQLYVSGVVLENEKPIAVIWIADQQGSILDHTRLENDLECATTSITSYNNTLVISGYAIIQKLPLPTYQTLVWTIDPIGTVQKSAVVGATSIAPKIFALNASNGILAAGFEWESNQKNIATLWKITSSGRILKTITLGSPNTSSSCKGIYCSPTSSSVFQKFSPIHYQLGL